MIRGGPTHCSRGMLDGTQYVQPVDMHTKVSILLLSQDLEYPPSGGPALEGGVGKRLAEDDVDNLFPEEELPALVILDYAGYSRSGGRAGLGVGALQVPDDGHDLCLAQGSELGVRGGLNRLGQGITAAGGAASVST